MSILSISGISDRKGNQGEELRIEVTSLYNVALHPYCTRPLPLSGIIASSRELECGSKLEDLLAELCGRELAE